MSSSRDRDRGDRDRDRDRGGDRDRDGDRYGGSSRRSSANECRIYVGGLPASAKVRDLEDIFHSFGKLVFIDLKSKYSSPFAFIEFEDARDARDAVRKRNGYELDGHSLTVEIPRGSERPRGSGFRPRGGGGFRGGFDRDRRGGGGWGDRGRFDRYDDRRGGGDRGGLAPKFQTGYHVIVTGLPPSTSWQDLKDLMREAGEVGYTDIRRSTGTAIVQFYRHDDMRYAIKKFNDYKFSSEKGETSIIHLKEESNSRRESRSRSRERRRSSSRSRSGSPAAGAGNSRSKRSPTPKKSRADSRSRSRSRSRSSSRSGGRGGARVVEADDSPPRNRHSSEEK